LIPIIAMIAKVVLTLIYADAGQERLDRQRRNVLCSGSLRLSANASRAQGG